MNQAVHTLKTIGTTLAHLVTLGGPVVAILLAMSVIALAIVLIKLWQFARMRIRDRHTARAALHIYQGGNIEAAIRTAKRSPNPVAQVMARAIESRARNLPEATIREELLRFGSDLLESLRAYFRPLEVIASLSPLLGLFGTVLGMIEAFQNLQQAGTQVNPAILSGGIWQALLTTAVGLAVAMPVIIILNWFERSVDKQAHEMDSVVTQVFTVDVIHPNTPSEDGPESEQRRTPHI